MSKDTTELEKMAFKNYEMPESLDFPEQMLFQALRFLYRSHEFRQVDTETARREKLGIMQSYKKYRLWGDIFKQTANMTNRLSYYIIDIRKNGCERCKTAVDIFTNMEKGPDYILERIKTGKKLTVAEWTERELSRKRYGEFIQVLISENDYEHPTYEEWRNELEPEIIREASEKQAKGELS